MPDNDNFITKEEFYGGLKDVGELVASYIGRLLSVLEIRCHDLTDQDIAYIKGKMTKEEYEKYLKQYNPIDEFAKILFGVSSSDNSMWSGTFSSNDKDKSLHTCETCKYADNNDALFPCGGCKDHSEWEGKDDSETEE